MRLALLVAALLAPGSAFATSAPLKVGVTLHPYYSWVANIAKGTDVEVRAILPGEVDSSNYQPSPGDVRKLADLDALVINGLGHDDFIQAMVQASGNQHLVVLRPSDVTPTMKFINGEGINSHTFLSFSNAIQQTYFLARRLGELRPDLAATFQRNATDYARRLRAIKASVEAKLVSPRVHRVITVHDGYSYLMQELGIEIVGVVEPAHGLIPSAGELARIVDLIKEQHVDVVLSEASFPAPLLKVLTDAGAKVYIISHIATGPYSADEFEKGMQANMDALLQALARS